MNGIGAKQQERSSQEYPSATLRSVEAAQPACWDSSAEFFTGASIQQITVLTLSDERAIPITGTICIADIRVE